MTRAAGEERDRTKPATGGVVAVLAAALLWGTTGTAAGLAAEVGPLAIGAAAMGIGGILQALVAIPPIRRSSQGLRLHRGLVGVGAASVAIYPLAFYSSMHLGGVAVGTVVSLASAPVASAVLERATAGTPLSRRWLVSVGLGVVGGALLCAATARGPMSSAGGTVASVLLGLVAGATYAVYSWASHGLMRRGVSRAATVGTVFGLGGVLLLPVLLVAGAPLLDTGRNVAVVAYLALIPMFGGYILFGLGLQRVAPSTATTLTMAEPALAALLAVVVLAERLSPAGWLGLGLIGMSLLALTLPLPRLTAPRPRLITARRRLVPLGRRHVDAAGGDRPDLPAASTGPAPR